MEDPWTRNTVHTHNPTLTVQSKQRTTEHSRWVNSSKQNCTEDHRPIQLIEQFKTKNNTEDHRAFQVSEQFKTKWSRGQQSIPGEWRVQNKTVQRTTSIPGEWRVQNKTVVFGNLHSYLPITFIVDQWKRKFPNKTSWLLKKKPISNSSNYHPYHFSICNTPRVTGWKR